MARKKTSSQMSFIGRGKFSNSTPPPSTASTALKTSSRNSCRAFTYELNAWELIISKSNSFHFQIMVALEISFLIWTKLYWFLVVDSKKAKNIFNPFSVDQSFECLKSVITIPMPEYNFILFLIHHNSKSPNILLALHWIWFYLPMFLFVCLFLLTWLDCSYYQTSILDWIIKDKL